MPDSPLPSEAAASGWEADDAETDESEETEETSEPSTTTSTPPEKAEAARPAAEFKLSTFILIFLFILGLWMLFDTSARDQIAEGIGALLAPAIGFNHTDLLLTMLCAGAIQMTISAIAYNFTTDWVASAKVQSDSKAIRPLQMKALRSGKKHHLESLKPHMDDLTRRQSGMMIGQLKGMAVTWFLLIAIYTWVGIFLASSNPFCQAPYTLPNAQCVVDVYMFGTKVNLMGYLFNYLPLWFLVFTLYTLPFNLVLRRLLKHQVLLTRLKLEGVGVGAPTPPPPIT